MSVAGAAVVQVLHRFYAYLDEGRYAELVALTCDDVRWLRQGEELRGHAAVARMLERRPTSLATCHVITNAFVTQTRDDEIEMSSLMTAYRGSRARTGSPATTIPGPFRLSRLKVLFRRSDVTWKIADQEGIVAFEFASA